MLPSERVEQFVTFFKALADPNRVKIVGLLAHQAYSVEELAAILGVTSATVSHHLQKLAQANLVMAHARQYYNIYALRREVLRQMAEQLLDDRAIRESAPLRDLDRYASQVLGKYLVRGKLTGIPSQLKKREVILRYLADQFEVGRRYPERRVNEILKSFHSDYAALRQELVSRKLVASENRKYWRT
jgi:predicted transcriptional regulator